MMKLRANSHANHIASGMKFGRWTVISDELEDVYLVNTQGKKEHRYKAKCQCECGNVVMVSTRSLLKLKSSQCQSCAKRNRERKPPIEKKTWPRYFNQLKRSAERRNLEFSLTLEDLKKLYEKQDGKCFLTGLSLSIKDGTLSVDRDDASVGYVNGNVQLLNVDINRMKWTLTNQEFISFCKKVAGRFP